jgi:hypothetical protein
MSSPSKRYDCYAILLHPGEKPSVLLLPEEGGWSLPHVVATEAEFRPIGGVCRLFQERLGPPVTLLRCVEHWEKEQVAHEVYTLEAHGDAAPSGARWVGAAELTTLPLAIPAHQPFVERALRERETGEVPARRNAWAQPGWFTAASEWLQAELARLGITATGPVEQFKIWSISCILLVPATEGDLFLKAAPPYFDWEPHLTAALSALFPGQVPEVLATDEERRWFLMRELTGPLLYEVKEDWEVWETVFQRFAAMQVACAERAEWLLSLGCPDRRLPRLAEQTAELLANDRTLAPSSGDGLTEEELGRLRALLPRFRELCDEVEASGVPSSLCHGDLHPGNIIVAESGPIVFDWTDACLSHPFLDATHLLGATPDTPEVRPRLSAAYLAPWQPYAPMERLQRLLRCAVPLSRLHQAVSYRLLSESVEQQERKEWAWVLPHYLRQALEATEAM